jgi:hypothetical protein
VAEEEKAAEVPQEPAAPPKPALFAATTEAPKAAPFPACAPDVPLPLWRYFRVRHSIKGYDAAGEYQKAVETFKAEGRWDAPDGGMSVGPKKAKAAAPASDAPKESPKA